MGKKTAHAFTVRYSEDEFRVLTEKVRRNRFKHYSEYIKDRSLNESTIIEDINGKDDICSSFDETRTVMIAQERRLREIASLTDDETVHSEITDVLNEIVAERKSLERKLNESLFSGTDRAEKL